ncbi:peptidoglycan DD-metalloendopeptidase family protein [Calidifontibacter sp. DB0510]|uniref:Peptidoglycan DD-metalloendopeptidase family protein n=1 Tax=Metallococcus carri TaxID=1656884 RepID=A0A967EHW8_9MICO|nr:peptidoglycan DD-metalloendopeptidase family protein [Metallococcus carri]NHN57288.1 peptidoglycan DD-metalloendopeptidase family protein [Metallococcus carri]NOP38107.1 peptidoglycan DD-metalloendopeptidase family protein [Calidifontibacter sp. DB2511S]
MTTPAPRHAKSRPSALAGVAPYVAPRRLAAAGAAAGIPTVAVVAPAGATAGPTAQWTAAPQAVAPSAAPAVKTATTANVVWLRYGDTGSLVRTAQQRLGGLVVDGSFGPATLARVKSFQAAHGLYVDGLIGPNTWDALGGFPTVTPPPTGSCTVTVLRYGSTGSLVSTAQQRLGGLAVDGSFGPATLTRVKSYQSAHGLAVTGAVDSATWTSLGGFPCNTGGGSTPAPPPPTPTPPPAPDPVGNPNAAYKLPWSKGASYRISQGPNGTYSHNSVWNDNAVDVSMPIGTPVLAARGGVVKSTGYTSAGGGNYVLIQDASGLCQVYFHLSSYSVVPGQAVAQGQRVAASGNSGNSSGPHLHFDLLKCSSWYSAATMPTVERGTSYPSGTVITSQNGG